MNAAGEFLSFIGLSTAIIAGTFTGSLRDPLFIMLLIAAVAIGATRSRWYLLACSALAFACVRGAIAYHNYISAGLEPWPRLWLSIAANTIIFSFAAVIGRLSRRMLAR